MSAHVKGLGAVKIVDDPQDAEGSVLVESLLTGKRYWVDGWRLIVAPARPDYDPCLDYPERSSDGPY